MDMTYLKLMARRLGLGNITQSPLDKTVAFLSRFKVTVESRTGAFMVCATKAAVDALRDTPLTPAQIETIACSFGIFIQMYHSGEVGNVRRSYRLALESVCKKQQVPLSEEMKLHAKLDVLVGICTRYLTSRNDDKQINGRRVGDILKKYEYA